MDPPTKPTTSCKLRSQEWFDNKQDAVMTALYTERYLASTYTRDELQSGRPIIGIAQTGSDLAPCNRHHKFLADRIRDGIRDAGGVPLEFPVHPIQETGKRPTASLDRNLTYLGLVEILNGYPIDGVVLTIGCDKTMPALVMAAAAVNIPAIAFSVGPMLNGYHQGTRIGSGTIIWEGRKRLAAKDLDYEDFMEFISPSAPSVGYCNTMGTAATMNCLAEVIGMQLPGSAAIPAPRRERSLMAYKTGLEIVEMVDKKRKPCDILTREAFENAIVMASALGASTNAPIHLNAIAYNAGVSLDNDDWQKIGYQIPLLVNVQPAGEYLGEDFWCAGGVQAVVNELIKANMLPHPDAITANGKTLRENCEKYEITNHKVIFPSTSPLKAHAGFLNLKGNLFDSAIMKMSVISAGFRERFFSNPLDPNAFVGKAAVFDGPEDYHKRINDPDSGIDDSTILVMRGVGPLGYPGAAEVVNMQPPDALIQAGIMELLCIGDSRQSGTERLPAIVNASPEAAAGGGLALLKTGDLIRIDLGRQTVNALVDEEEWQARAIGLEEAGGYKVPASNTPWEEIHRSQCGQLSGGMVMKCMSYHRIADSCLPRHNH
jgi:dihydroxy-acid dehydratase